MIVFLHATQIQFQPDCAFSKGIGVLLSLNSGAFLYMFSAFYVKTYKKNLAVAAAKKDLLDAPPKAKPQELNQQQQQQHRQQRGKNGLSGYMDDFNNNKYDDVKAPPSTMSPLYAKLVQNGHLTSTERGLKLD